MIKKTSLLITFIVAFTFIKAADLKLFPEIPGWKKNQVEKVYTSDDLWELINGAADIFLSYYFEDLNIAEYENGDEMIRVELYRHKTLSDTYGIYSCERMPDYPQVSMGAQGYKSQGVLNFFAGNFYVKIMSAGVKESNEQTITMVAEKISGSLNQSAEMPKTLALFPEDGKIDLSDSYIAQNFMGYSFLHNAYVMKYDKLSGFQMFIIDLPDKVQIMTEQYIELVKKENVTEDNGILIINDQYNGRVFMKVYKGYLIGVINSENDVLVKEYIDKIIQKLG
jgi:hypothetical protein